MLEILIKTDFIIFKGDRFTLEWYYDARGKSIAHKYFQELPIERQKKLLNLVKLLGNQGKIFNKQKFREEGDQIFALKPMPDRFFCFFVKGAKIIVTNAYEKKSDKLSPTEKKRALRLKEDYTKRCEEGTYYE